MADGVTRVGNGVYRVQSDGLAVLVYVAGTAGNWWAFSDGRVFRSAPPLDRTPQKRAGSAAATSLTAPMPATVVAVNATVNGRVRKGDVLVVLDAMKMEMPVRADADGIVKAVHCKPGELVQADAVLVELE
ncbi:MAG: biotin/lipoyl-containing protein [Vicinamibacterales bacterium]